MSNSLASFTTGITGLLLAAVALFIPSSALTVSTAVLVSVAVVALAVTWPKVSGPTRRRTLSAVLALIGLVSVWLVALLPAGTSFSAASGIDSELWLAPIAASLAVGVMLVLAAQLVIGPDKQDRPVMTSFSLFGLACVVAGAGWVLIVRDVANPFEATTHIGADPGASFVAVTVAASLAAAGFIGMIPVPGAGRVVLMTVAATLAGFGLQLVHPDVLSTATILAAGIAGLTAGMFSQLMADELEAEPAARAHSTSISIASGLAPVLFSGIVAYLMIWLTPALT